MSKAELNLSNPELATGIDMSFYEEMAATPLDEFVNQMPGVGSIGYRVEDWGWRMGYADLRAPDEGSSKKAIAMPFPYANPLNPAMFIRAKAIQEALPEDIRILMFPNNTRNERYYSLDPSSKENAVQQLGRNILRACEGLDIEELAIVGFSQGASVGASMAKDGYSYDVHLRAAYLAEPADVVERTPKELKKAFMGTGLGNLNRAINDSGIPALSESQLSRGGLDSPRQLLRFAGIPLDAKVPENVALYQAMTANAFARNMHEAYWSQHVDDWTVARMAGSLVCLESLDEELREQVPALGAVEIVEGYGHEGGDNVIDNALRVRAALIKSGFVEAA